MEKGNDVGGVDLRTQGRAASSTWELGPKKGLDTKPPKKTKSEAGMNIAGRNVRESRVITTCMEGIGWGSEGIDRENESSSMHRQCEAARLAISSPRGGPSPEASIGRQDVDTKSPGSDRIQKRSRGRKTRDKGSGSPFMTVSLLEVWWKREISPSESCGSAAHRIPTAGRRVRRGEKGWSEEERFNGGCLFKRWALFQGSNRN